MRVATDGRVFQRKRAKPGTINRGTLLIDGSTSLCVPLADIEEIARKVPHATVAIYGGNGFRAQLRIIAKNGRTVSSMADWVPSYYGSNSCDGPALLWLSRQAGPRLWYSDGYVNGATGSYNSPRLMGESESICIAGRIVHVAAEESPHSNAGVNGNISGDFVRYATSLPIARRASESHADYILRAVHFIQNGGRE